MSTNVRFKVGDRVVRKANYWDNGWPWRSDVKEIIGIVGCGLYFKDSQYSWHARYFNLYVEPVATPTPKFKVGDTVWAKDTKLQILGVSFLYRTNNGSFQYVHEDKLSATPPEPPKPREITVDGVVYREVI